MGNIGLHHEIGHIAQQADHCPLADAVVAKRVFLDQNIPDWPTRRPNAKGTRAVYRVHRCRDVVEKAFGYRPVAALPTEHHPAAELSRFHAGGKIPELQPPHHQMAFVVRPQQISPI